REAHASPTAAEGGRLVSGAAPPVEPHSSRSGRGETVHEGGSMSIRVLALAAAALLPAAPALAQQQQPSLPEGPGREIVQASCGSCHGLNNIVNSAGYDKAGWQHVIEAMIALPPAQADQVTTYLATHFPPRAERAPTRVAGAEMVKITEFMAPTLGQRVRDPLEARDGALWWTGMFASLVGRMDPRTGEMREYKLPQGARPHGIAEDHEGNIWYTG